MCLCLLGGGESGRVVYWYLGRMRECVLWFGWGRGSVMLLLVVFSDEVEADRVSVRQWRRWLVSRLRRSVEEMLLTVWGEVGSENARFQGRIGRNN